MPEILQHLFTGKDNKTFDIARVLWAISIIIFLALAIYHVLKHGQFDPLGYGTGLGGLLAGGGAGVGLKSHTEPQ